MHNTPSPHDAPQKSRRRKRRLSLWEMFVMAVGYAALLYILLLGLVRLAVWFA